MTHTGGWAWRGDGEEGGGRGSCHRGEANLRDETNYATSRLGDDQAGLGSERPVAGPTQTWARTALVAACARR